MPIFQELGDQRLIISSGSGELVAVPINSKEQSVCISFQLSTG